MSSYIRPLCFAFMFVLLGCGNASSSGADASVDAVVVLADATPDVATVDTWDNFAGDFFTTYCVDCHAGAPSGRDYRTVDDVLRDQDFIRCGVSTTTLSDCDENTPSPRQFPIGSGPHPSDAARARLVQWIDDGAMH
jgi:hypothetical protein